VKDFDVIENVLPQRYWAEIMGLVTHKEFPWNFFEDLTFRTADTAVFKQNPEIMNSCGFSHLFFDEGRQSPYWQFIKPLMFSIAEKTKFRNELRSVQPFRVKANLQTQVNSSTVDNYNMPHIDPAHIKNGKTNWIFLYYVSDSDGDTFLFNETTTDGFPPEKFTLKKRVPHKANSALVFKDNMYHASSNPVKDRKRININFNLLNG